MISLFITLKSSFPPLTGAFCYHRFSSRWKLICWWAWNPFLRIYFLFDKVSYLIFANRYFRFVNLSLHEGFIYVIRSWRQTCFSHLLFWYWFMDSCVLQILIDAGVDLGLERGLFFSNHKALINIALSVRFKFEASEQPTFCRGKIWFVCCWLRKFEFLLILFDHSGHRVPWTFLINNILFTCQFSGNLISIWCWHDFLWLEHRIHIMPWFDVLVESDNKWLVYIVMPFFELVIFQISLRLSFGIYEVNHVLKRHQLATIRVSIGCHSSCTCLCFFGISWRNHRCSFSARTWKVLKS